MSAFYFSQRVSFHLNYLVLNTYLIEEMKGSSALGNRVVCPVQLQMALSNQPASAGVICSRGGKLLFQNEFSRTA